MSVNVRPYRRGGWEVDIAFHLPDGRKHRERRRAPVTGKSAAQRWGEMRERELFTQLTAPDAKAVRTPVPTLEEFAPRFIEGHAKANQHKASGVAAKALILRVHLVPRLGRKKLTDIRTEDVQRLKAALRGKAPKTVNNVLSVLNTLLKKAAEWGVMDSGHCAIRLLKAPKGPVQFYDFDEYERLVSAARTIGREEHLIILLGGEAGLRSGEMVGLEWTDINWDKRQMCVQRNVWQGIPGSPKGGRIRYVTMTTRLSAALRETRHLRGPRVLYRGDGREFSEMAITLAVKRSARRASLEANGPHRLRHTFCSHLAMRGAPARAIQELAGHAHITTTQRYMHLSPAALDQAIALLERKTDGDLGDILETRGA